VQLESAEEIPEQPKVYCKPKW